MFDHNKGMALSQELLKSGEEKFDIGQMKTCGGFIEDEEVFPFLTLDNMLGELQPL